MITNGATCRSVFLGTGIRNFTQHEIPIYLTFCTVGRLSAKSCVSRINGEKESNDKLVTSFQLGNLWQSPEKMPQTIPKSVAQLSVKTLPFNGSVPLVLPVEQAA